MAKEIERKFLVSTNNWRDDVSATHVFRQGYLSYDSERTVRVRATEVNGFLTIKGITTGLTRDEFEYEIPLADALALLQLCERPANAILARLISMSISQCCESALLCINICHSQRVAGASIA